MELIQSVAFNYPVLMVSSSDHITGKTGLTLAIQMSKAGGPFVPIAPTVTEIGFGQYTIALTTDDVDTLGAFSLHIDGLGADPYDSLDQVIPALASLTVSTESIPLIGLLKDRLGIALTDTSLDVRLVSLLNYAIAVVEGSTRVYFGAPKQRIEYHLGGEETIYLEGHLDDSPAADNPVATLDPTTSLVIERRTRSPRTSTWELLVENDDWERRDQAVLFLRLWGVWPCTDEFRLTYLEGYADAPADIKELILEIAMSQSLLAQNASQGTAGIKSETLGDFSYDLDPATFGAGNTNAFSDQALQTIQRYKRKYV